VQSHVPDLLFGIFAASADTSVAGAVEFMLDCVVRNEGQPDVVQISGGEPTIHPDFFAVLDMAKARPIKHLMVNTNGVRIAQDADFARRLKDYMPRFELYSNSIRCGRGRCGPCAGRI